MDLYTETLLDHYEHPHHAGALKKPHAHVIQYNPTCVDTIQVDVIVNKEGTLKDMAFSGSGCVLSQASMSILSDMVIGKQASAIQKMTASDIEQLIGMQLTPSRVNCAILGLTALKKATEAIKKKK